MTLYTIGHGNASTYRIIELLQQQGIEMLVDVRSSPYSKYVPQFNREMFQSVLERAGLEYRFAGDYLGGRPKDPTCYKNGQIPDGHADFLHLVDYPAVMTRDWYQNGIERLLGIAQTTRVAVMCSEEDPARCHRQHLISQTLLQRGVEVVHIRGNGALQKAWLQAQKDAETDPARQMSLFSMDSGDSSVAAEGTEPELTYEPIQEDGAFAYTDFLQDEPVSKKKKPKSSKTLEERKLAEDERLREWLEKNQRK